MAESNILGITIHTECNWLNNNVIYLYTYNTMKEDFP